MDTERFLSLRRLFDQVVELPAQEAAAVLARLHGEDPEMGASLQELLAAHRRDASFLERTIDVPASALPAGASAENFRIGPYRVQRRLGSGGMGEVYLAVRDDGTFRKQVALKLIRPDRLQDPTVVDRFRAERQVLASLEHVNIARILDAGAAGDGAPYYVMEFIEGVPLDRYCDEKKLGLESRLQVFQQVCQAVHYLHNHQVIHRDIKPGNVLVTQDGLAKLLDFGIAKMLGPAAPEITGMAGSPLTMAYASPEQIAGRTVTGASDVYSLGVVLYFLVTGVMPDPLKLQAPSLVSKPDGRMPESETRVRRKLGGDLDKVVLKALERDPPDRYPTARELADDLERFLEHRTVHARPASPGRRARKFVERNRLGVAAAAVMLLLLAVAGWFGIRSFRTQSELDRLAATTGSLGAARQPGDIDAIFRDLASLRQNLRNPLLQSGGLTPQQVEVRQGILRRAAAYLARLEPYGDTNPRLGAEVAEAYLKIGELQQSEAHPELADRSGAVASYTAAARQFGRQALRQPGDPEVRSRLEDVERRLRRLEAGLPAEALAALHPAEPAPAETAPPAPAPRP